MARLTSWRAWRSASAVTVQVFDQAKIGRSILFNPLVALLYQFMRDQLRFETVDFAAQGLKSRIALLIRAFPRRVLPLGAAGMVWGQPSINP